MHTFQSVKLLILIMYQYKASRLQYQQKKTAGASSTIHQAVCPNQKKVSQKTSELHDGCNGQSEFPPSCQPHRHVNHAIMPTIHHQVVGKCPKACEFTGENTLGRQTLRFFMDKVAPGVAEVRSLVPRLWASICESGRKKGAGCSKSSISQKNIAKNWSSPAFAWSSPLRECVSTWCAAPAIQVCKRL